MDEQLRKRLKEAAKEHADRLFPKHRASENDRRAREDYQLCRDSVIAGGEFMFKECGGMTVLHDMRRLILAQCKEWLKEHIVDEDGTCFDEKESSYLTYEEFASNFEADMNKLWKEKK